MRILVIEIEWKQGKIKKNFQIQINQTVNDGLEGKVSSKIHIPSLKTPNKENEDQTWQSITTDNLSIIEVKFLNLFQI